MTSFLIQKIIEKYCDNNVIYILTFSNLYNYKTLGEKYALFEKHILHNKFLNANEMKTCIFIFMYYQKILFGINKFKRLYKRSKLNVCDVDTDLNLNKLNEYKPNEVIQLVENNTVYKFALLDLLRIFNSTLRTNEYLACSPRHPRNPYTNIPFSFHNIFNIYYAIQFNTRYMIKSHIHSYIENCLNLRVFFEYNLFYLKSNAVVDFINTQEKSVLFRYVCDMFDDYRNFTTICVDRANKDHEYTVSKVNKLLYYYLLIQQFTIDDEVHIKYERILIKLIKHFTRYNPTFGRRIVRVTRRLTSPRTTLQNENDMNDGKEEENAEDNEQAAGIPRVSSDENIHNTIFPQDLIERYNIIESNSVLRINNSLGNVTHYDINPAYENNSFRHLLGSNPFSSDISECLTNFVGDTSVNLIISSDVESVIENMPVPENTPLIEEWSERVLQQDNEQGGDYVSGGYPTDSDDEESVSYFEEELIARYDEIHEISSTEEFENVD